ncbi:electron transfer flavoprotein-ubiquinone oxidoreductase [Basilea psittacipulmonis]|uniref:Electron transfer flavoprotein-ubiquinone oxidoreductase n=1 Tax=Basilea psittacipulmonis DSM 24701 TaxID=1072685 RepID=A0A077DJK4_9BURK|nr:electron transfer flavoprotein-ubiquinone oxidoreductase [Basilea psittacipulmonis]AIL33228.1 electron transfer flavoprotein-ubiquinone oxidoreductase [Basilea psittacipulmonis DSM 24701]
MSQRESMEYDVVVVGAGPAGLATAIRLKQINADINVCVLEKASEVGAHILSGAIMDPKALSELIPDYQEKSAPLNTPVKEDEFYFLSQHGCKATPSFFLPACFKNHGNYIVRLGELVKWLGEQAEALGVDVFPGFAATQVLYDGDKVIGVGTGDMGLDKAGNPTSMYQPGMNLLAKYTVFAEGSRGQLGKELIQKFSLDKDSDPQTYSIGIKELWEIPAQQSEAGKVIHTAGWPLDSDTYGGGFIYHLKDNKLAIGLVVGLDYKNTWLSPFEEFQRYKTHPKIAELLKGGKRLSYGARAITAGGLLSLPKTTFPGGLLVGCEAGFLNVSRIKGSHAAIKTGMLAAESIAKALSENREHEDLTDFTQAFKQSWLYTELNKARNFKQWFKKGRTVGVLMTGVEQWLLKGNMPWTIHNKKADYESLLPASQCQPIQYPKPDGVLSFDRPSSVFLSNTHHDDNEPVHLVLSDPAKAITVNWAVYHGPEERFCPAGVYEFIDTPDGKQLQINAQNCVHCKTCDIKDPSQNITWKAPQGGEGPVYSGM